jgi:non-homologous end joining protein Ku
MTCQTITGVHFGPKSQEDLRSIRQKHHLSLMLQAFIPAGTMANIFLGNDALKSVYNVSSTDFEMMARAMAAVPEIERAVILRIARMAALDTQGQESAFWREFARGVVQGCPVEP